MVPVVTITPHEQGFSLVQFCIIFMLEGLGVLITSGLLNT